MKERNLSYEQKFRKYLFSFDFETHKEICNNLNVRHNQESQDAEELNEHYGVEE